VNRAPDAQVNRKLIFISSAIACLVMAGVFVHLVTSKHARSSGHITHPESHAPANFTAVETAARKAMAVTNVAGPWMQSGWAVLSNPPSRLGVPVNTDGDDRVDPGNYTLVFACAGTGKVEASLWAGRKSATRVSADCSMQPQPIRLRLSVRQAASLYVRFAAAERETVAIRYKLAFKSPRR
jgi:uncharacterized protein DUF6023